MREALAILLLIGFLVMLVYHFKQKKKNNTLSTLDTYHQKPHSHQTDASDVQTDNASNTIATKDSMQIVDSDRMQPMVGPVAPTELMKGDFDSRLIDMHQEVHRTFASKYNLWVGPLRYSYSTKGENVSASGRPLVLYHHSPHMDEGFIRSASLHEYIHLVQKGYGAPSRYTTGGDIHEDWRFSGPRWWTEGSADWIMLVYCKLNRIRIDGTLENRMNAAKNGYQNGRQRCHRSGKEVTIKEIITPNLADNPEWKYVEECDIYFSHVYQGGLLAVDFLQDGKHDESSLISIINMIKDVRTKDDWERAFLQWSRYSSMAAFYSAFALHVK